MHIVAEVAPVPIDLLAVFLAGLPTSEPHLDFALYYTEHGLAVFLFYETHAAALSIRDDDTKLAERFRQHAASAAGFSRFVERQAGALTVGRLK